MPLVSGGLDALEKRHWNPPTRARAPGRGTWPASDWWINRVKNQLSLDCY